MYRPQAGWKGHETKSDISDDFQVKSLENKWLKDITQLQDNLEIIRANLQSK